MDLNVTMNSVRVMERERKVEGGRENVDGGRGIY